MITEARKKEMQKEMEDARINGLPFLESDKEDIDWSKVDKVPDDKSKL